MKLLLCEKYEKNDIEILVETSGGCLCKPISVEEAKREKADMYINMDWHYVIGREVVNFIFLSVSAYRIYGVNEQIKEIMYQIEILINREKYTIQITQEEFYNEKWLKEIKTQELLFISKRNYQKLIKVINPKMEEGFFFENIGIHKIENKYYYAMSNCTITAEGKKEEIRALQEGFNLEINNEKETKCAEKFIKYNMYKLDILYPIHCISILAVLRSFLKEQGIPAGAVLWIDGKIASGKTQLAITAGDFFNRKGTWNEKLRHLHSPKSKTKDVAKELVKYQNAVYILDDIKKEETVRNRENAKNVTDLIVRSVYMGKIEGNGLEKESVDSTAIITGEFFKEQISTMSRILYLNIGGFLEEKRNSEILQELQDDSTYFADFMNFFIQWLICKIQNEKYAEKFSAKMEILNSDVKKNFNGELSTRIIETIVNFQFCSEILRDYFIDININNMEVTKKFLDKNKEVFMDIGRATLNRSLNYSPIIAHAFHDVLYELTIKDCRYGEEFLCAMEDIGNYAYWNDMKNKGCVKLVKGNSISAEGITDTCILTLGIENSGVLLEINNNEILIVKCDDICTRMRTRIKEMLKKWNINYYESDYTDDKILTSLLAEKCLYAHKRDDGAFSKIVKYPEYFFEDIDDDIEMKDEYKVVKVNLSKVDIDRVKLQTRELKEWMDMVRRLRECIHRRGRNYVRPFKEKIEQAIKEINKLIDIK